MIDILIPVLDRPQNVEPLLQSLAVTTVKYKVLFLCSPGDDAEIEAVRASKSNYVIVPWGPERSDYTKKMNFGYRCTSNPWILLGSDDIKFERGWDTEVLAMADATRAKVIATNDCANPGVRRGIFGTHCLVDREYVDTKGASFDGPGFLMHEGYDHNWCDRELCDLAQRRGVYAFAPGSHIVHRHPNWKTAQMDHTYRKGLSNFSTDRRLYLKRMRLWH